MVIIYDSKGKPVSRSKNLRGILEYSRKHSVAKIRLVRHTEGGGGTLLLRWRNGSLVSAPFADWSVLNSWVHARKHLREAVK